MILKPIILGKVDTDCLARKIKIIYIWSEDVEIEAVFTVSVPVRVCDINQ